MVIEDDPSIRETLAELLTDEDYQVLQAEHGRAALDLLEAGARPALLLVDLMMPVMTGWQLLEILDRDSRLKSIPVVVFSGAHEAGLVRGARDVLKKPVHLEHLLQVVARHVA